MIKKMLLIFTTAMLLISCNSQEKEKTSSVIISDIVSTTTQSIMQTSSKEVKSEESSSMESKEEKVMEYGAEVLFFDDFNEGKLDTKNWSLCPNWDRQGGSKWVDDAVTFDEDNLIISASPNPDPDMQNILLTGGVRTKDKYTQKYGYFEASMILPPMQGLWGAFWMMTGNVGNESGNGEDGTEIDIIESIGYPRNVCNSALHWNGYGDAHKISGKDYKDLGVYDGEYHKFAVHWTAEEYKFFVDDKLVWTTSDGGVSKHAGYMKLTVESAPWAGKPVIKDLPVYMYVDYVKVLSDLPDYLQDQVK